MTQRPIEELLADLDFRTGGSKLDLAYEAAERRDEIVPHLLTLLELVIDDPEGYAEDDHDLLPYALAVLAYLNEERAHPVLLRFFSLPGTMLNKLIGDLKTSGLPAFLLHTCGGSLDGIRSLALNRDAYEFIRWSALEALTLAVPYGSADREEMIKFMVGLLSDDAAQPGSAFWDGLANSLCDLYPDQVMDVVRKAYDDGIFHSGAVSLEDFEEIVEAGLDEALERLQQELLWHVPSDLEGLVAWCDPPEDRPEWWGDDEEVPEPVHAEAGTTQKKKKAMNKKKKKMAKASRKKNR
jgi:hypothetical protein